MPTFTLASGAFVVVVHVTEERETLYCFRYSKDIRTKYQALTLG
jgi:hypothetical protein